MVVPDSFAVVGADLPGGPVDGGHRYAAAQVDAVPGGFGQLHVRLVDPAGQQGGEQDPVVRAVRLGPEHGDLPVSLPGVQLTGETRARHAVADDDHPGGHAFSTRTAQILNSGIPEIGSTASLVTELARPAPA